MAAITLLDYCSYYLEGIWTHLAYLINLKVVRRDGGSSSDNEINCTRSGKAAECPLTGEKKKFLGLSRGLFMEGWVLLHSGTEQGWWEEHLFAFIRKWHATF